MPYFLKVPVVIDKCPRCNRLIEIIETEGELHAR